MRHILKICVRLPGAGCGEDGLPSPSPKYWTAWEGHPPCPSIASGYLALATLFVVFVLLAGDALACPMCKAALGSHDGSHGDLVGGFFWSILFMLSMPFVIFGSLSTYMYMLVRRARREQAQRQPAPAAAEMFAAAVNDRSPEPAATAELPSR